MNLPLALILVWTITLLEDIWFNRLLVYQLNGEAKKLNKSPAHAVSRFREEDGSYSWIILAIGFTFITISFPEPFSISITGLSFFTGVLFCIGYMYRKLRIYWKASLALKL